VEEQGNWEPEEREVGQPAEAAANGAGGERGGTWVEERAGAVVESTAMAVVAWEAAGGDAIGSVTNLTPCKEVYSNCCA
jgi:hypothetical protein